MRVNTCADVLRARNVLSMPTAPAHIARRLDARHDALVVTAEAHLDDAALCVARADALIAAGQLDEVAALHAAAGAHRDAARSKLAEAARIVACRIAR